MAGLKTVYRAQRSDIKSINFVNTDVFLVFVVVSFFLSLFMIKQFIEEKAKCRSK